MKTFETILSEVVRVMLEHSVAHPWHYRTFELARGAFLSEYQYEVFKMTLSQKAAAVAACPFADEVGDDRLSSPTFDLDDAVSQALLQMLMRASGPALRTVVGRVYGDGLAEKLVALGRASALATEAAPGPQRVMASRLDEIMTTEISPSRSLPADFVRAVLRAKSRVVSADPKTDDRITITTGLPADERRALAVVADDVVAMAREPGAWWDVLREMIVVGIDDARRGGVKLKEGAR
jgi:hypothetical protein